MIPLLALAMVTQTFASSPGIVVGNQKLAVSGITKEERVLVPLRAIFEALNATVDYDSATKTITGNQNGKIIILTVNDKIARVNGEKITLDVPATIIKGSTLVPVRFIGESLGATVNWHNNTVLINSDIPVVEENKVDSYEEFMVDYGLVMLMQGNSFIDSAYNIIFDEGSAEDLESILLHMQDVVDEFVEYGPAPEQYAKSHKVKLLIVENFKAKADLMLKEIEEDSNQFTKYMAQEPDEVIDRFDDMINPLQIFMINDKSQINHID